MKWKEREHPKGRKPVLLNSEIVAAVVFKQRQNIATKKALYEILEPSGSYNRFVVALNRVATYLIRIITAVINFLRREARPVKFTDSTDIPVCLNKNARYHRTMMSLSEWSKTGKGSFYGLKLHLSADCEGRVLALKLTPGNSNDRNIFKKMNAKLRGLFVADAGYVSEPLEREFHIPNERLLLTGTRKNMKKLATEIDIALLNLRMRVEIHFRVLKLCYGLVTSFPRSIDGYLTHYLAAITAHLVS
ncbi:transposase [Candidatus Kaiserbacteria bacterium]|nr:transposase [Candidatus Kaiserbacteria bacterium]